MALARILLPGGVVPEKEKNMRGLNHVVLIGRLGRDPELRTSKESGAHWGVFTLATNRGLKVGEQWEETTDWHRVKCFGRLAENCSRALFKGSLVAVEGYIQNEQWTDADGRPPPIPPGLSQTVLFLARFTLSRLPLF